MSFQDTFWTQLSPIEAPKRSQKGGRKGHKRQQKRHQNYIQILIDFWTNFDAEKENQRRGTTKNWVQAGAVGVRRRLPPSHLLRKLTEVKCILTTLLTKTFLLAASQDATRRSWGRRILVPELFKKHRETPGNNFRQDSSKSDHGCLSNLMLSHGNMRS